MLPWLAACQSDDPPAPPPTPAPWGAIGLGEPEIRGEGTFEVTVEDDGARIEVSVRALTHDAVLRGVHVAGTWEAKGDGDAVLWRQGYQSWSASGVFPLVAATLDDEGWPALGGDAGGFDVLNEEPGTSWWAGLVGRAGGGSALVGALSARTTKVATAFDPDGTVHVVWGARGEAIAIPIGETLVLDRLVVRTGEDPNEVWRAWAEAVAYEARVELGPLPPVGWSTWYQYYEDVTEDDVRANAAVAAALDDGLAPIGLFQVDDGWERAWGDWTANERFPSGTATLAADLAAAGFVPGLWLAPFYVDRATATYADHPDWFVRGLDGEELEYLGKVVLDVTHPDAAAWLSGEIRRLVAEGWSYLKLDFLYAGAEEGQRHVPMTGAQAYAVGLDLLREAAGPETFVLACGAPLLPSVGFADAFRTGPDIAFTVEPDPRRELLRNQARSTAARGFTNGRWWWVDADALLVRDPFGPDEARGSVVATAASGGAWLLGDALAALPAERLAWALDPDAIGAMGVDARPEDPLAFVSGFDATPLLEIAQGDDRVPTRWSVGPMTALLNLGDEPIEVDGPGGEEVLTGATAGAGPRTLAPGAGELWR